MHGFLLLCLVTATTAYQLGYSYQPIGQTASLGGTGFAGNAIGEQYNNIRFDGGSISGVTNAPSSGFNGFDSSYDTTGSFSGNLNYDGYTNGLNSFINVNGNDNIDKDSANVQFNKEFFTYTAADDEYNDYENTVRQLAEKIIKNVRVIFIKAPENRALTNAVLQLAKQAAEDRTAIYVLNKQTDIGELANQLQTIRSTSVNKPAVHFIKYRTTDEAEHAQELIKAQYEVLNGPSRSSYEGVAPLLNLITPAAIGGSSIGAAGAAAVSSSNENANGLGLSGSSFGSGNYLPPILNRI